MPAEVGKWHRKLIEQQIKLDEHVRDAIPSDHLVGIRNWEARRVDRLRKKLEDP